jgi:hypothetical protein
MNHKVKGRRAGCKPQPHLGGRAKGAEIKVGAKIKVKAAGIVKNFLIL